MAVGLSAGRFVARLQSYNRVGFTWVAHYGHPFFVGETMVPETPPGEWSWLFRELDRMNEKLDEIPRLREDIATLKVKSGMWGAVGASIVVITMLAIQYLG